MMNTEATLELVRSLQPDVVILATGSKYVSIPVKGIEAALTPDKVLKKTASVGNKIVVIGGGLVGAETALELGNEGKDVTILEMLPGIVMQDEPLSQISLMNHLAAANVTCMTSCKVVEIKDGNVIYEDAGGKQNSIAADTIISATGLKADTDASAPFADCAKKVVTIGDARQAKKIFECFHQAWQVIREL